MTKEDLLRILDTIMHPKKNKFNQKEVDQALISFCAECPDPVGARWLIVECLDPMTDDELVNRALSMPLRPISDVPTSVVPGDHPKRTMA